MVVGLMAKVRPDLQGSRHHLAKLTEEIVADARVWYYDESDPITVAELADHYGVTESTMSNALRGSTWKHVKQAEGAKGRTKYGA
jgi:predicted transcriptional regulator